MTALNTTTQQGHRQTIPPLGTCLSDVTADDTLPCRRIS
jgi:hypothetical protein